MRGHWMGQVTVPDENLKPVERHTVRRVVDAFKPYKRKVAFVAGIIVITGTLGIVNPLLQKAVFDNALFGSPGNPDCGTGCPNMHLLTFYVILMILIPIVSGWLGILQRYHANVVGPRGRGALRAGFSQPPSACRSDSSRPPGPARSSRGWPTTSAA